MLLVRPGTFVFCGILYMLLGTLCLAEPQVALLSAALVCGATLVLAGLLAAAHWFVTRGWPGSGASLASAVILCVFGGLLLVMPQAGVLTVGLLLGVFFLFDGVAKLLLGVTLRGLPGWAWFAFNGGVSLLLAVAVFARWPVSATWVLALVVGIHLLLKGWATLILGLTARAILAPRA